MNQIILSRSQVASIVAFCDAAGSSQFVIAKDHDGYVGYSSGATPDTRCLFYFKGCNPTQDADFDETARHSLDGDEFCAHLQLVDLRKALENPATQKVRITVTPRTTRMDALC